MSVVQVSAGSKFADAVHGAGPPQINDALSERGLLVADRDEQLIELLERRAEQHDPVKVVGRANNGVDALALVRDLTPAVAVLDTRLALLNGPGVLNAIEREDLNTHVLLIARDENPQQAYDALASGALGYLPRAASSGEVWAAIEAVAQGDPVAPPTVLRLLIAEMQRRSKGDVEVPIEPRAREILELLADDLDVRVIASRLHLSPKTVHGWVQALHQKLGVRTTNGAVAAAIRRGLIV